jgi:hypothetical protein
MFDHRNGTAVHWNGNKKPSKSQQEFFTLLSFLAVTSISLPENSVEMDMQNVSHLCLQDQELSDDILDLGRMLVHIQHGLGDDSQASNEPDAVKGCIQFTERIATRNALSDLVSEYSKSRVEKQDFELSEFLLQHRQSSAFHLGALTAVDMIRPGMNRENIVNNITESDLLYKQEAVACAVLLLGRSENSVPLSLERLKEEANTQQLLILSVLLQQDNDGDQVHVQFDFEA